MRTPRLHSTSLSSVVHRQACEAIGNGLVRALHPWQVLLQRSNKLAGVNAKEAAAAGTDWLVTKAAHRVCWLARGEVAAGAEALVCEQQKWAGSSGAAAAAKQSAWSRGTSISSSSSSTYETVSLEQRHLSEQQERPKRCSDITIHCIASLREWESVRATKRLIGWRIQPYQSSHFQKRMKEQHTETTQLPQLPASD